MIEIKHAEALTTLSTGWDLMTAKVLPQNPPTHLVAQDFVEGGLSRNVAGKSLKSWAIARRWPQE